MCLFANSAKNLKEPAKKNTSTLPGAEGTPSRCKPFQNHNRRESDSRRLFVSIFLRLFRGKAQRHAHLFGVKYRDGKRIAFAKLKCFAQTFFRSKLAYVYEACDAFLNRGKRAVLVKLDNHALDFVAFVVFVCSHLPRIVFKLFNRKGNLTVFDINYFYLYFVAHLKEVTRI